MDAVVQMSEKPERVSFSLSENVAARSASPIGRSLKRKGRMRVKIDAFPNPHPALRATLSRRERDTPLHDGQTKIPATQAFEPYRSGAAAVIFSASTFCTRPRQTDPSSTAPWSCQNADRS